MGTARPDASPPGLLLVTDAINESLAGENSLGAERAFEVMRFKTQALLFAELI